METGSADKRVDDLVGRADRFEADVKGRFDRSEDKVDVEFGEMATKEQMEKLDARFDRWSKIGISGVATIAVAVIIKLIGA
jgi:hypothetical protein